MINLRFLYCSAEFSDQNTLTEGFVSVKVPVCPPGAHHGCHCRPGSCSIALWDTGHPEMTTLMNLSASCPVAPIRSILLGNKCVWLTQTKHAVSLTHTHWLKHTLPVASTACHTINTNWPFFMATNIFHMLLASSKIILNFYGHNKSTQLLVLGSEKPQDALPGIFVNMICETFQTTRQTAVESCTVCGWRRSQIPPVPRLMVPLLCLQHSQQGSLLNASQPHTQAHCQTNRAARCLLLTHQQTTQDDITAVLSELNRSLVGQ